MRVVWYLLTVFFGVLGGLGLLRGVELLVFVKGAPGAAGAFTRGAVALYLTSVCLKRARSHEQSPTQ